MYQGKTVGIVFPAYNEEKYITAAVKDFLSTGVVDTVYVINNNSRDRTADLARAAGARVIDEPRQGYGFSLRRGLLEAREDLIVLSEPDGTFLGRDVFKLLAYSHDFHMVLGTRTAKELIWAEANMGFFLRVGNEMVAKMVEFFFNGPLLTDCGCTFRLIRREDAQRLNPYFTVGKSHFLPEMVILALRAGLSVIEIPLNYKSRVGESKITGTWKGTLVTGMRMVGLVLSYRLKSWVGWRPS